MGVNLLLRGKRVMCNRDQVVCDVCVSSYNDNYQANLFDAFIDYCHDKKIDFSFVVGHRLQRIFSQFIVGVNGAYPDMRYISKDIFAHL